MGGIEFTREDVEKITSTYAMVETMQGAIERIETEVKSNTLTCSACVKGFDSRLRAVEDRQNRWLGRDSVIVVIVSAIVSIIIGIAVWIISTKGG